MDCIVERDSRGMGEGWSVQGWVHVHGVRTQVVGGVMGGGNG